MANGTGTSKPTASGPTLASAIKSR